MTAEREIGRTVPDLLRVSFFGPFSVEVGATLIELSGAKNQALLSYLLFDPKSAHARSHLAGLLWPESAGDRARQSLRASLYKIRKAIDGLDNSGVEKLSERVFNIEQERIAVSSELAVTSDVAEFVAAVAQSEQHGHDAEQVCDDCLRSLERAADLYRGEVLAGMAVSDASDFEEWLVLQRESLKNQALRVLDRLVRLHQAAGHHQAAHDRAFQLVAIDRYDEFAHRAIMHSLAAQGHRAQAVAHFEICRAAIVDDLGAELDPETQAMFTVLRQSDTAAELAGDSIRATDHPPSESDIATAQPEHRAIPPQSVLPFHRNDTFVGRDAQIADLATVLVLADGIADEAAAAVLTGIGGIGKTQLAIEFAYRYGHRFPGGVFWITCSDRDLIPEELAELGGELGLGLYRADDDRTIDERVKLVRRHWQTGERKLLIFDGCETEEVAVDWLPRFGAVSTLVTSRKSGWPVELPVQEVPVQPLDPASSQRLMLKTASHLSDEDAGRVAEAVAGHPLALRLAAQFLARLPGLSIDNYVEQLEQDTTALHESLEQVGDAYSPTADELSLERTFALSYDQLTFDEPACLAARALLDELLQLPAGEPVARASLLQRAAIDPEEAQQLIWADAGLQRLLELGLVSTDGESQIVLHRLVGDYLRAHITTSTTQPADGEGATILTPKWRRAASA